MSLDAKAASFALRPFGGLDLDRAAFIHAAAFAAAWDQRWDRQAFAELLAMPGAFGLMAEPQGKSSSEPGRDAAVGLLLMRVAADEAEIVTLAVLPQWRRHGVGFGLMRKGESEAASRGATRLFLEVAEDNFAARKLYGALGFAAAGRRAGYYARGSLGNAAAIVMAKSKLSG
jgi:ribosomal-protein-alanine N-acetyltransferase